MWSTKNRLNEYFKSNKGIFFNFFIKIKLSNINHQDIYNLYLKLDLLKPKNLKVFKKLYFGNLILLKILEKLYFLEIDFF